jgi:Cu+-exporting ATPase
MTNDPVCGMAVDERKAAATMSSGGLTYYFCCGGCKSMFEKDPRKYTESAELSGDSQPRMAKGGCCCSADSSTSCGTAHRAT